MNVSVVSPEEVLFEGESTQVVTRTTEGDDKKVVTDALRHDKRNHSTDR